MVWTAETSCGFESSKIASIAVPYLQGRGLDIGCGMQKVWPSAIGVDNGHHFGRGGADIQGDGTDLSMFADASMDYVFSSHFLEHVHGPIEPVLREWWRVLKVGGRLVLYLPHKDWYPNIGEAGANPDHQRDMVPDDVIAAMKQLGMYWSLVENETRSGTNEYSFFQVYRKRPTGDDTISADRESWQWHRHELWQRNPGGRKRALIIRYGAIGDQLLAASILPALKAQGFHVTYNTTPEAQQVLLHDPNVDEWLIQAKDFVPNEQLGPYWASIAERYDRVINLCESVEGGLLTLPGRLQHQYSDEARRSLLGTVNYADRTADIAGVPRGGRIRFYATEQERKWARATRRAWSETAPVVAVVANGSSPHKVYPWFHTVIGWLVERTPAHVCLLSDPGIGKELQAAMVGVLERSGADMSRVHPMGGGVWTVRQALSFCQVVDVVAGPETGPLNAVCHEPDVAKVIMLSHSSHENLTRDWVNTTVLTPDAERAPCYGSGPGAGCHRLHYTWEHCHQHPETHAALCASAIAPKQVFEAIALSLGAERKAA